MKNKWLYLEFRFKVLRRKIIKFIEFTKLYRDWIRQFDKEIEKAILLEKQRQEDPDFYDCPIHGLQDGPDCPRC